MLQRLDVAKFKTQSKAFNSARITRTKTSKLRVPSACLLYLHMDMSNKLDTQTPKIVWVAGIAIVFIKTRCGKQKLHESNKVRITFVLTTALKMNVAKVCASPHYLDPDKS